MGRIIAHTITHIKTSDGLSLVKRVTKVEMPNGKYRYPVDYYDATPGVVKVSEQELNGLRVPVYDYMI